MIRFALIVASTLGFVLTAAMGNLMVPLLRAFQSRQQPTRPPEPERPDAAPGPDPDEAPERPAQPPTMGGLCLMVGVLAAVGVGWTAACVAQPALLGSENLLTTRLLIALFGALLFGGVGLADDLARIRRRAPLGLRRGTRLLLEAGAGAVVLLLLGASRCLATGLALPGLGYVELGVLAPLVWEVGLVALAESVRIADGIDGLCCGTAFAAQLGLMLCMTILGWFPLAVFPAALAGALMAFLLWNFPPAKLRLGSVGSLFLAGMLGCVPLCIGWPDLTLPLALPFWLEGGMVAVQIAVYQTMQGQPGPQAAVPLGTAPPLAGAAGPERGTDLLYLLCHCHAGRGADRSAGKNQLRRGAVWQHSAEKKQSRFPSFSGTPAPGLPFCSTGWQRWASSSYSGW